MKNSFKTTDSLFSKIREDLASFDAAALIDEGRFHKDVKYILFLLGIKWYREAETILEICNYKADLPDDFKLLDSAFRCDSVVIDGSIIDGVVLKKLTFDHYPETRNPDTHEYESSCTTYYNQPSRCIFNRQEEILVQRNSVIEKLSSPVLLKPGNVNTKSCCTSNCQNIYSNSEDIFMIQNRRFNVNFKEGTVYVVYHAFPLDENTGFPMIPDNEVIEKCIEYYIKMNILENLWVNGDADVAQKISYFNNKYKEHLGQAQYETKLPSFEAMVKAIRLKKRGLDMYQL
jgi:hypothetical protein